MRRALPFALAAGLLLAACADPAPTSSRGSDGEPASLLPRDRLALPETSLAQFEALIASLEGTPVVVNVWGSWCPPCEVEAPELAEVSQEFADDVQFLGVDILDQRKAAREFIIRHDWQYPSVFDPDAEIRDGLGYIGQPITILYDRNGTVAFEWQGAVTAGLLREEIRKVL